MITVELTKNQLALFEDATTIQNDNYIYYRFTSIVRRNLLTNEIVLLSVEETPEKVFEYLLD